MVLLSLRAPETNSAQVGGSPPGMWAGAAPVGGTLALGYSTPKDTAASAAWLLVVHAIYLLPQYIPHSLIHYQPDHSACIAWSPKLVLFLFIERLVCVVPFEACCADIFPISRSHLQAVLCRSTASQVSHGYPQVGAVLVSSLSLSPSIPRHPLLFALSISPIFV